LLVLQSMNLNQDDIATVRSRLREEITERECLLAAVELFEKYAASGQAPRSIKYPRSDSEKLNEAGGDRAP
jgi:hypothetical protein